MLGLRGLRIFEATGAGITDLGASADNLYAVACVRDTPVLCLLAPMSAAGCAASGSAT